MVPENWTATTWVKVVCVMGSIILLLVGAFGGQSFLGAKVTANAIGVTANKTEIEHRKEIDFNIHNMINKQLEKQDAKLDEISLAVTAIQATLEVR